MSKQVVIRGEKRSEPNLRKLARALIALAELSLPEELTDSGPDTASTQGATPGSGEAA